VRGVNIIEGDFIETIESLIFDVKGLTHPPNRVVAFVRYVPSPRGNRVRGNVKYVKLYSLTERYLFLKNFYPQYLHYDAVFNVEMQSVPTELIKKVYKPRERLNEMVSGRYLLDEIEKSAVTFAEELHDLSGVPLSSIGVSGSILVGLHGKHSDLDLIVYGYKSGWNLYHALRSGVFHANSIARYTTRDLIGLYKFRVKDTYMPLRTFMVVEARKVLQGKFSGRDYFIRLVKEPCEVNERYGDRIYMSIGRARIKAVVIDDSNAIFTPCSYSVDDVSVISGANVPISEVFSFRGRFCECAFKGDTIVAEGKVEQVLMGDGTVYYRLVVGGHPEDFIVPVEA